MFYIQVKKTKDMGNGVFATKDFTKGEVIEVCPVIPIPRKLTNADNENELLDLLRYWFFEWGEDKKGDALILGYGMIYNHSTTPNASYESDFKKNTVTFIADEPISKGSEIFIDYRYAQQESLEMLDPVTHKEITVKT